VAKGLMAEMLVTVGEVQRGIREIIRKIITMIGN
jgi:hypothetical protein